MLVGLEPRSQGWKTGRVERRDLKKERANTPGGRNRTLEWIGQSRPLVVIFMILHLLPDRGEHGLCLIVRAVLEDMELCIEVCDDALEADDFELGTFLLGHTLVERFKDALQLSRVASCTSWPFPITLWKRLGCASGTGAFYSARRDGMSRLTHLCLLDLAVGTGVLDEHSTRRNHVFRGHSITR